MKNLIGPLLIIFLAVPLAVLTATYLWNVVLTEAVTWANPVGPWQNQLASVILLIVSEIN